MKHSFSADKMIETSDQAQKLLSQYVSQSRFQVGESIRVKTNLSVSYTVLDTKAMMCNPDTQEMIRGYAVSQNPSGRIMFFSLKDIEKKFEPLWQSPMRENRPQEWDDKVKQVSETELQKKRSV